MLPMLATPADQVPQGPQWIHEVKWDGMRVLVEVRPDGIRAVNRTGGQVGERFPELESLAALPPGLVMDGEVVLMRQGRPSFAALSERIHTRDRAAARRLAQHAPISYLVFDLLAASGSDLTGLPWRQRRERLDALDLPAPAHRSQVFTDGAALWQAMTEQGLEGVVSKQVDGVYLPGKRSRTWLKVVHRPTVSVLVGGWRWEQGHPGRLGSVLIGRPSHGGLQLLGRVGTGLNRAPDLLPILQSLRSEHCPFREPVPPEDRDGAIWVRPQVVLDVRSQGPGSGGRLRHSSLERLRPDLGPADLASPGEATVTG